MGSKKLASSKKDFLYMTLCVLISSMKIFSGVNSISPGMCEGLPGTLIIDDLLDAVGVVINNFMRIFSTGVLKFWFLNDLYGFVIFALSAATSVIQEIESLVNKLHLEF